MKTKNLFIALMLLIGITAAQAQTSKTTMFDKFSNNKDITAVFISKAMLGSMSGDQSVNGIDIEGLKGKLDQIEIYTSEKAEACKSFRSEMEVVKKGKTYEVLMSIKDGDQNINFYAQKDKEKFSELLMFVDQPDECVIIRILGSFTSDDIQNISKKMK